MTNYPLMKCGCVAQAIWKDKPVCAIHFGIGDNAGAEPADVQPNLEGRKAKCCYSHSSPSNPFKENSFDRLVDTVPSSLKLPFFEYKPDQEYDKFYCGCWGWD